MDMIRKAEQIIQDEIRKQSSNIEQTAIAISNNILQTFQCEDEDGNQEILELENMSPETLEEVMTALTMSYKTITNTIIELLENNNSDNNNDTYERGEFSE